MKKKKRIETYETRCRDRDREGRDSKCIHDPDVNRGSYIGVGFSRLERLVGFELSR